MAVTAKHVSQSAIPNAVLAVEQHQKERRKAWR